MTVTQIPVPISDCRERFVPLCGQSAETTRPIVIVGIGLALLLPLCLVGCETNTSGEDVPHHTHHTHAHQRPTFPESVAEIRSRSVRFMSNQVSTDATLQEWKKQKLLELIRHLPELATDTDLKKNEWDRVNAIAKELLSILRPGDAVSNNGLLSDSTRFAELVAELEKMVSLDESLGL